MAFYPLNLVFATAAASATIFLGFLPTRNVRSEFFGRQVLNALFAWVLIALASPSAIRHFHFIIAFLCFSSWWQFRRDRALSGKMWLSTASGLGISVGVMLILAVTPRAFPPGLPPLHQDLLLASIYLGGAVIGLAYVCYAMTQALSTTSGITRDQVQRYVGLLTGLVLARAGILLALAFLIPEMPGQIKSPAHPVNPTFSIFGYEFVANGYAREISIPNQMISFLGLVALIVIVLPVLAFVAQRATRSRATSQAISALIGICFAGILAEILARLLVL